jgi:hypothetical protein
VGGDCRAALRSSVNLVVGEAAGVDVEVDAEVGVAVDAAVGSPVEAGVGAVTLAQAPSSAAASSTKAKPWV